MKLSGPRAFRPVVTLVAVVIAPLFVAIIIATWSGGLVVGARQSRSGRGRRGLVVEVVGAQRSRSRRGPWSMWSELGVARWSARRGSLSSSLLHRRGPLDGLNSLMWLAYGSAWLAQRLAPRLMRLPCCLTMARPTWRRTHLVRVLMMS